MPPSLGYIEIDFTWDETMTEYTKSQLSQAADKVMEQFYKMFPGQNSGTVPAPLPEVTCAVQTTRDAGGIPVAVSDEVYWRYGDPPRGVKLFLLTKGGVAVTGTWDDDGRYLGWQYLFKRDKSKEPG